MSAYDAPITMCMTPAGKSLEKAPPGVFKMKTITSPSMDPSSAAVSSTPAYNNYRNCYQPGFADYRCPSNCLRCPYGTPEHKYWDDAMCKYKKTVLPSEQVGKANSAVAKVDLTSENAAMRLQIAQLKAAAEMKVGGQVNVS